MEYGGLDPGYETLGIGYLAELDAERAVPGLGDALGRSVDFLTHMIHPDGGLGGVHGSRHTSLYVPSGIELLAHPLPAAEAIAGRVAAALPDKQVVTLDSVDAA